MTRVAVVIPCHNAEPFLRCAIDSALAQTRPVARVFVVDDCSTDQTARIAGGYASRGYPVVCLRTPANSGPGAARNLAIRAATEPLIGFLDADDVWEPSHCAEVCALLERFPTAVLAYGESVPLGGEAPPPLDPVTDLVAPDPPPVEPAPAEGPVVEIVDETAVGAASEREPKRKDGGDSGMLLIAGIALGAVAAGGAAWGWYHRSSRYLPA